jgi:hypothetical protein
MSARPPYLPFSHRSHVTVKQHRGMSVPMTVAPSYGGPGCLGQTCMCVERGPRAGPRPESILRRRSVTVTPDRQTTSFNDFSIEAGILLRGNGVPHAMLDIHVLLARGLPDAGVSQPTQLSHSYTHTLSLLTAYLTLALTLRQLISLPSHS